MRKNKQDDCSYLLPLMSCVHVDIKEKFLYFILRKCHNKKREKNFKMKHILQRNITCRKYSINIHFNFVTSTFSFNPTTLLYLFYFSI